MYVKKADYIQKVTINFGSILGCEKDEDAFVTLKEMTTLDSVRLSDLDGDRVGIITYYKEMLPNIIVDHSLYKDENTKMTNQEVAEFIFAKLDLASKVMNDYNAAVFRSRPNNTKEK